MSFSRRKFMKAGVIATAFAAIPMKFATTGFGFGANHIGSKLSSNGDNLGFQPDQLFYYNKSTFAAHVGTEFRVRVKPTKLRTIVLEEVRDFSNPGHSAEECFSLLFASPPGRTFPQNSYEIQHDALGTFTMFVVPVLRHTGVNTEYHESVFNRITTPGVSSETNGVVVASAGGTHFDPPVSKPVNEWVPTKPMERPIVNRPVLEEPIISRPEAEPTITYPRYDPAPSTGAIEPEAGKVRLADKLSRLRVN